MGLTVGPSSATGTSPTGRELPTQQTFFDHVMHDIGAQDMVSVVMSFEVLLQQAKRMMPGLKSVYWRSDNAGCFVNALLLYITPLLGRKYNVHINMLLHNEAGDGKNELDAHFGVLGDVVKVLVSAARVSVLFV